MWLAASNLHWPPEIDLLEHWGAPTSKSGVDSTRLAGTNYGLCCRRGRF